MQHDQHALAYAYREELANTLTHGLGTLLAIAGLSVLVPFAALRGDATHVVGATIFGTTMVLLYLASTLYHAIPHARAKPFLQALDHGAIYLLIAGTYTPFTLVTLRGAWGWSLFGVIWGLALVGIVLRSLRGRRHRWLAALLYVGMGWVALVAIVPLLQSLSSRGLLLLLGGGLAYTGGVVFYLSKRLPYAHAIWHLFVLAGSALHFFAVFFEVIPPAL